jgi:serine/threonine protein kinase
VGASVGERICRSLSSRSGGGRTSRPLRILLRGQCDVFRAASHATLFPFQSPSLSRLFPQVKRVGKYEIGKTLGEGTFGKVKIAVNTETGEKVRPSDLPARLHDLWGCRCGELRRFVGGASPQDGLRRGGTREVAVVAERYAEPRGDSIRSERHTRLPAPALYGVTIKSRTGVVCENI